MKDILLFIWQLPQNIVGYFITKKNCKKLYIQRILVYYKDSFFRSGVSLGKYIILDKCNYGSTITVRHEHGHQKQSLYLGWLYLPLVGLPSLCVNCWDRLFHKKWSDKERSKWYFSRYPEKWADKLGGVNRTFE